jgi:hypothetical protein
MKPAGKRTMRLRVIEIMYVQAVAGLSRIGGE